MPTNILRNRPLPGGKQAGKAPAAGIRRVLIKVGRVSVRAELADTATAARLWSALPLYSVAETWGNSIHFQTPVETGRERVARMNGVRGELYYWAEERRVLIGFGPTPISRPNEIRLPLPCNVLGRALDDVAALASVTPGEKVSITALEG